jgi:DNA-binding response OmpR family regulator
MAKILLIEPDKILADTYARALEQAGHKVTHCFTAQTAVLVADQAKPELVILELQLVEHSGIEFLYEFRSYSDWQDVPVLIHTTVPISEFADNLELLKSELNVAGYLYKPQTDLKDLVAAVNRQLATIKA